MPLQGFDQAIFAKVLSNLVERFSNPIGVEYQRVSGKELALGYRAFPVFEQPHYGASGIELFTLRSSRRAGYLALCRLPPAARTIRACSGSSDSSYSSGNRDSRTRGWRST